jgi:hypothetical protein
MLIDCSTLILFSFQKTIPLQDVTDVRKAKTAAIFPNAIEIVAGAKRVRIYHHLNIYCILDVMHSSKITCSIFLDLSWHVMMPIVL